MSDYQPKHRANKLVKTYPPVQPAPRHRSDRTLERLGAEAPDIRQLFHDITVGNPFR